MEEKSLEGRKVQLEEQKLELEREKLKLEVRKMWWTTISVLASVIVSCATLSFAVLNTQETLRAQLQLETVKLMFASDDSGEAVGKGRAIVDLLGDNLPSPFRQKMLPDVWVNAFFKKYPPRDPAADQKIEFFKQMALNPKRERELCETWMRLFPSDVWVNEFRRRTKVSDKLRN